MTKALISGLAANTHYEVRVRYEVLPDAEGNGGGVGEFSDPEQFWTWPQAPSQPKDITANAVNSSAIRVSWSPPDRPGGILSAYTVYISFLLPNGTAVSRNQTVNNQESDRDLALLVGELPSGTIIKVAVRASTKASLRNEGGGLGEASSAVFIMTAADSSVRPESTRDSSTQVASTKPAMTTPSTDQFSTPGSSERPEPTRSSSSQVASTKPAMKTPSTGHFSTSDKKASIDPYKPRGSSTPVASTKPVIATPSAAPVPTPGHLRIQCTNHPATQTSAFPTSTIPTPTAFMATTTLTTSDHNPDAPPQSIVIISTIPAKTSAATTTTAPTPAAGQKTPDVPSTTTTTAATTTI
ncbi:hypothetical protein SprV_0802603600 [Sparganum proliferum]